MANIVIFSGTTEGRQVSEYLSELRVEHEVFVATEYGKVVMADSEYVAINEGRLEASDMEALFTQKQPMFVIDATHPYATLVSENIKAACERSGLATNYIRVTRDIPMTESLLREDYPDIEVVLSTAEAVEYLKSTNGNILLTTGVKTLKDFAADEAIRSRLVARILPSKESFELALEAGLSQHQIIAMEGPFLTAMNEATIDQYNIKTLVTKNSGIKGGFLEKLEAAKNKGAKALVIDLQKQSKGISVDQVKTLLSDKLCSLGLVEKEKNIAIVGIGAGNDETMTIAGMSAIKNAKLLIGASRMLESVSHINSSARTINRYMPYDVLDAITKSQESDIAILCSGDTGFYSGAAGISQVLDKNNVNHKVLPGISSISYFASKLHLPYSDTTLCSAHGRPLRVEDVLKTSKNFFTLVSGPSDVNRIVSRISNLYEDASFYVGYNLGMESEEIACFNIEDAFEVEAEGLYVLGVVVHG